MTTERLTPLPHLVKSIRSRNWNLSGALMEWVDNSLQHGRAKNIAIYIGNGENIAILDDGVGIDDINRVFTLGDASAYGDLSQIGQYGVGATDAMIFLGEKSTVETVRDKRKHKMTVDWMGVEESGEWPLRYTGTGKPAKKGDVGTKILVSGLFQKTFLKKTSENVAKDLGLTFAPALHKGAKIMLYHRLINGDDQEILIEPFEPVGLTDVVKIKGSINTLRGQLRWTGRVGLSPPLVEKHNGVHIAFGHRIIEMTRDPFMGVSAPTLYVEVQLDDTTPWKYQLSDHKDKVVRYRDDLMESIHDAIKPLLDKAKEQATNLALLEMTAEIEAPLNKALKAAGALFIDPDEEPGIGGIFHNDEEGGEEPDPRPGDIEAEARNPQDDGDPAKEIIKPNGIKIEYVPKARLEGRAFAWEVNDKLLTIKLEKERFSELIGWPPNVRNQHVIELVVSFLSHAIDMMFWDQEAALRKAVSKSLFKQIEGWSTTREKIAPYLYNRIIGGVVLH